MVCAVLGRSVSNEMLVCLKGGLWGSYLVVESEVVCWLVGVAGVRRVFWCTWLAKLHKM